MQIIKDRQLTTSDWTYITDREALTAGNITVSLQRFIAEKTQLKAHNGQVGVRVHSNDDVTLLKDVIADLNLVEVDFPVFSDGRGFSHIRLLRDSLGYQGEIRAVGSFMADQAFYLSRVGVNAFAMENEEDLKVALSTLDDFSVKYQISTN